VVYLDTASTTPFLGVRGNLEGVRHHSRREHGTCHGRWTPKGATVHIINSSTETLSRTSSTCRHADSCQNIASAQDVLIRHSVCLLKFLRFICILISRTHASSQGCIQRATKIPRGQHVSNEHRGLIAQGHVDRAPESPERLRAKRAIDANLCLVPAAISVIDAHLSTIEPSNPSS
jgi:hypothetical protein